MSSIDTRHPVYVMHQTNYDSLRTAIAPHIRFANRLAKIDRAKARAYIQAHPLLKKVIQDAEKVIDIMEEASDNP